MSGARRRLLQRNSEFKSSGCIRASNYRRSFQNAAADVVRNRIRMQARSSASPSRTTLWRHHAVVVGWQPACYQHFGRIARQTMLSVGDIVASGIGGMHYSSAFSIGIGIVSISSIQRRRISRRSPTVAVAFRGAADSLFIRALR